MGGVSTGDISRESHYHGRDANILRGTVRLDNNGGFIQMATNFAPTIASDGSTSQNNSFRTATPIDASKFTGIEIDVHCDVSDTFNVQCVRSLLLSIGLKFLFLFLTYFFSVILLHLPGT